MTADFTAHYREKCHSFSRGHSTAEQLCMSDFSNDESMWHRQGEETEGKEQRRDFSDKGGLCVTITLGANHQSKAVGGLVSARGRRSSWTENRGRTVSALLFIWRAALATSWKHRNSGRRVTERAAMRLGCTSKRF